jgi:hypothetical protein
MVQGWGEDNDWGIQWSKQEVQTVGTCRCKLLAEQGELSKVAQLLHHQFSIATGLADQAGAGGNNTPAVGTDEPADDSHRTYSPDHDGIHAVGLTAGE